MDLSLFKDSLAQETPPSNLSPALEALWYDGKGDWEQAHNIAQDDHSNDGSWIHAYLHRKEGDQWNAEYWYRRAGRISPNKSLEAEWEAIAQELLGTV